MTSSAASETDSARKRASGLALVHPAQHLDPAAAGQVHVEQHDVGLGRER